MLMETSITTPQHTNAFYIQSPRLQSNSPFRVPMGILSPSGAQTVNGSIHHIAVWDYAFEFESPRVV